MEMNAVVSPSTALAMSFINLFGGNKGYDDVNERQNSYDITTIKKIMEEEKKVREETIFAPVPEEIRRPTYLE